MNKSGNRKKVLLISLLSIIFTLGNSASAFNQKNDAFLKEANHLSETKKQRVLVVNAYHEGFHWTDRIMQGVKASFSPYQSIELFINYMDAKRCSDSVYLDKLKNLYAYKYKSISFDAIITTDDHALDFLLHNRDSIFPNVPVVFCGINDFKPERISHHEQFTGVHESYDVEGTIQLILKLHPNTKEIAVISDATLSGKAFNDRIKRIEPKFNGIITINHLTNLTPNELSLALKALSKETIIIWSIYIRKPDGSVWTSEESIKFVAKNTKQPIYCVWDVVGQGVIGGKITDPVYQGERSSKMVLALLNGTTINNIKVEDSPLVYKFDFNLLKQFNISETDLPPNNIIINKPISFYQMHRGKILGVASIIIFLICIVILLIFLVQKQKQAQKEISIKNTHLEKTRYLLEKSNKKLMEALEIAKKSTALEEANKQLIENEKFQQKLNEALRISNLTKDKFFAIIAHDLRSPFNSILGISAILNQEFDAYNTEQQKKFLAMMDKTIQNTYRLVENLLIWSRSQSGELNYGPSKLNLYCLAHETSNLLNQSALNKSISISNNIDDSINVMADKDMLSLILRNLIANAIKFTPRGGNIELTTHPIQQNAKQNFVEILIKDNGIGIPKEILLRLFDISESTHTPGTEKEKGTGLGLILCKEFVEKHQGKIWVESEVGVGSVFIFTLPIG